MYSWDPTERRLDLVLISKLLIVSCMSLFVKKMEVGVVCSNHAAKQVTQA